jgi:hypothetical protein
VNVTVFCSSRDGVGHTHLVTRFEPSRHRVDVDGRGYWCAEILTMGDAATQACRGRLKRVGGGPMELRWKGLRSEL